METSDLLTQEEILHLTSLRELFGAFAHEISQPLNAIMIASQVLQLRVQRSQLPDQEKEFLVSRLGVVLSQVQRASGVVEQVRGLSRRAGLEAAKTEISTLIEKVQSLMGQQFMGRGIELSKDCSATRAIVSIDSRVVEWTLIQSLAFARDVVESIGAWHDRNEIEFEKTVAVNCAGATGEAFVRVKWGTGRLSQEQALEFMNKSSHVGLSAASSVIISLGGNLEITPSSLLITVP